METIKAFPPVDALIAKAAEIDYQALWRQTLNVLITIAAFTLAILTVARDKWVQYEGSARVQIIWDRVRTFATTTYQWVQEVGIPEAQLLREDFIETYQKLKGSLSPLALYLTNT